MEPESLTSPESSAASRTARPWVLTVALGLLIVLLGALIRFEGITSRGPRSFDTGSYILEARWLVSTLQSVRESLRTKILEMQTREDSWRFAEQMRLIRERTRGVEPRYARPGHPLLIAPAIWLVGDTPWVGALVSAVTGTLTLVVVLVIGTRLYGPRAGLMAALTLAVSGYHVLYSTQAWADMNASAAAALALYFYIRSRELLSVRPYARLIPCGLLCGAAFTIHDRFVTVLLVLWLLEACLSRRAPEITRGLRARRIGLLTATFASVLVVFEIPYYAAMIFLRHWGATLPFPTYFEELIHHVAVGLGRLLVGATGLGLGEYGSPYANFLTYPFLLWLFNGPVLTLCMVAGCAVALRARRSSDWILLAWFFLPLIFFSLQFGTMARMALVSLPAGALLAGRAFERLPGEGSPSGPSRLARAALVVFVAAITVQGVWTSRSIASISCGHEDAISFLRTRGTRHISTHAPISQVYVGVRNVARPPASTEEMNDLLGEGFRYYLVDFHKESLRRPGRSENPQWDLLQSIEGILDPVFECSNDCAGTASYIFEINIFFFKTLELWKHTDRIDATVIRIYDLAQLPQGEEEPLAESATGGHDV